MHKDLSNYRISYEKSELLETAISDNPLMLFQKWFYEAEKADVHEPNAMTVATIGADGYPKSRVVLLKKFTHEGFIFYTNYHSDKGTAIEQNPKLCLSFFWGVLERQVIIKGIAEKLSTNLSDGYFESRPKGSQLGAWASDQSKPIASRDDLEQKLKQLEQQYENKPVQRPDFWGGYLVRPQSIEFWQGRPNRLHDRILYTLTDAWDWKIQRLQP